MTDPQGAQALAARLHSQTKGVLEHETADPAFCRSIAVGILGEHGLFVPDVTKHEPFASDEWGQPYLSCSCGWEQRQGERYLDHLTGGSDDDAG